MQPQHTNYTRSDAPVPEGTIVIERGVSAQEFGPKLNRTSADVIRFLLNNGEMITATMDLSDEQMELFALEIGAARESVSRAFRQLQRKGLIASLDRNRVVIPDVEKLRTIAAPGARARS